MSAVRAIASPARQLRSRPALASACQFHQVRRIVVPPTKTIKLLNDEYRVDEWTNLTPSITSKIGRRLHLTPKHPLCRTRKLIESHFPTDYFEHHSDLSPIVTVGQNFDSLGFPKDHPGRSRTDTYYVNHATVLRTHSSAHQADLFAATTARGFTVTADVYRRDAIDRSHYPVFHQMEGARIWNLEKRSAVDQIRAEMATWKPLKLIVQDTERPFHSGNPLQTMHSTADCEAVGRHLKRSIERVVEDIFAKAKQALLLSGEPVSEEPLQVRWVDAYFPFTSPSWELEVYWQGQWLELLGCGVVQQPILDHSNKRNHIGWAFGLGLERLAMLLFNINDIRLFWSQDRRFLEQFAADDQVIRFKEFSKHPVCYKDVSFWLPTSSSAAGGQIAGEWHENDFMEIVRGVGGDMIEDVALVDQFTNPKTGKKSLCYRINYRSLERTLTNKETNDMHDKIKAIVGPTLGVELR